jgi:serine/threonine protein kinase
MGSSHLTKDGYDMDNRLQLDLAHNQLSEENKIGEGSSGVVYKVTMSSQFFALKIVYPEKQKAFLHEVSFFKKYQHPNIVKYFGHSEIALLLLLEFCIRGDLYSHIVAGQYDTGQARNWLLDVAAALSYLHSQYVVHCDLKSDNVLIDGNNRAKLSDFDGCWLADEEEVKKEDVKPRISATVEYMPPEFYVAINAKKMEPSIDIYAFGLMMWEVMNKIGSWMWAADADKPMPNQLPHTDMCDDASKRPSGADIIRRLQPYQRLDVSIAATETNERHHSSLRHTG